MSVRITRPATVSQSVVDCCYCGCQLTFDVSDVRLTYQPDEIHKAPQKVRDNPQVQDYFRAFISCPSDGRATTVTLSAEDRLERYKDFKRTDYFYKHGVWPRG